MGHGNIDNLRPFSADRAAEMGSRGGKKSGESRREKRTYKQLLELALSQKVTNKEGDSKTKKEVAAIMLADKCMRGDLRAIELSQSILGEQPSNKIELTGKNGADLIPAKRLSEEEAAQLMKKFDEDY